MAHFSTRTQNVKFAPLGADQALSNTKTILQPGAKRQCPPGPRFLPPIFANKSRKILSVLGKDPHGARHSVKVSKEDEKFLQAECAANHKKTSWTVFYKVSMHVCVLTGILSHCKIRFRTKPYGSYREDIPCEPSARIIPEAGTTRHPRCFFFRVGLISSTNLGGFLWDLIDFNVQKV
jgi:hypothetical protein